MLGDERRGAGFCRGWYDIVGWSYVGGERRWEIVLEGNWALVTRPVYQRTICLSVSHLLISFWTNNIVLPNYRLTASRSLALPSTCKL